LVADFEWVKLDNEDVGGEVPRPQSPNNKRRQTPSKRKRHVTPISKQTRKHV